MRVTPYFFVTKWHLNTLNDTKSYLMSSNIHVQRICEHCGNEFTARTTVTRFCSSRCRTAKHKSLIKADKIEASNNQTQRIKTQPIEQIKAKEFLTVQDIASLLNCSVRTVYRYLGKGNLKTVNLGTRLTRVKRSEIDKLFA